MPNDKVMTLKSHAKWLRKCSDEIASSGYYGWGNTCLYAADAIDAHLAQHAAMVEKLRELSTSLYSHESNDSDYQNGVIAGYEEAALALDFILSTEPAGSDDNG